MSIPNNTLLAASSATVVFDNNDFSKAVFPADAYTLTDTTTGTGLRVNLPDAEDACTQGSAAVCSNKALLNQLDGFSVNPRIRVCFSNAIDFSVVPNQISIDRADKKGSSIGINQVIIDSATNCLFAKPNSVLDQQTRYILRIRTGDQVQLTRDSRFTTCLASADPYCAALAAFVASDNTVAAASMFTTLSATSWLEQAYQYVDQNEVGLTLPAGFPWVFPISQLSSITWNPDNGVIGSQTLPLSPALDSVGSVAFGLYLSPNFLDTSGLTAGSITTAPNRPVAVPQLLSGLTFGYVPVSFHVFLPKNAPPRGGYPVVIYGHGLSDNQFGAPTYIASTLASAGYATVALEITGHGFGPNGTVTVKDKLGLSYTMTAPGRGIQINPEAPIGPTDGCVLPGALGIRDCGRQTAVDLFALVKTIQRSNGLMLGLSTNSIYYVGQSFGSIYGTMFQAVDPSVTAAALSVGGGPFPDVARLALNGRPLGEAFLCSLQLLNVKPSASCPNGYNGAGAPPENPFNDSFNDNYPYPNQAPLVNTVAGALQIQSAFEATEWLGMLGDALSYAPHLKISPLGGNRPKNTMFQFGVGDLEVPNPLNVALARAAGAQDNTSVLQFGAALAATPNPALLAGLQDPANLSGLPVLPHRMLSNTTVFGTVPPYSWENILSMAQQKSVADFFNSGGRKMPDANTYLYGIFAGQNLFTSINEMPLGLNFFLPPPSQ